MFGIVTCPNAYHCFPCNKSNPAPLDNSNEKTSSNKIAELAASFFESMSFGNILSGAVVVIGGATAGACCGAIAGPIGALIGAVVGVVVAVGLTAGFIQYGLPEDAVRL